MSGNTSSSGTQTSSSSGAPPQASGQSGSSPDPETEKKDAVAYDTYRKVLGEKKKADDKLSEQQKQIEELSAKIKEREEAELKAKGEIEKLLKIREEELAKEREKSSTLQGNIQKGLKLDAVLNSLSGKLDPKYWHLLHSKLDDVVIDPTNGNADPASAQKVAQIFEQNYPEIITKASGVKIPNGAAQGTGSLTLEEWKKLPAKEMKARMHEVKR
jgi:hypothetical protein